MNAAVKQIYLKYLSGATVTETDKKLYAEAVDSPTMPAGTRQRLLNQLYDRVMEELSFAAAGHGGKATVDALELSMKEMGTAPSLFPDE